MTALKTVLLVEDNEDDALFFQRAVTKHAIPFNVQVVQNGQEAIDYMMGNRIFADRKTYPLPKFIITDMPVLKGSEFLLWLKNHPQYATVPTIVLGGSSNATDVENAYQNLRVHSYFEKPASQPALERIVKLIAEYWAACVVPKTHDEN